MHIVIDGNLRKSIYKREFSFKGVGYAWKDAEQAFTDMYL